MTQQGKKLLLLPKKRHKQPAKVWGTSKIWILSNALGLSTTVQLGVGVRCDFLWSTLAYWNGFQHMFPATNMMFMHGDAYHNEKWRYAKISHIFFDTSKLFACFLSLLGMEKPRQPCCPTRKKHVWLVHIDWVVPKHCNSGHKRLVGFPSYKMRRLFSHRYRGLVTLNWNIRCYFLKRAWTCSIWVF